MNNFNMFALKVMAFFIAFNFIQSASAQCSFSGLDETYCETDEPVTLVGDPEGGIFSGPGMTGDVFDPLLAGPGVHTITYELLGGGTGDAYYVKSNIGDPWGSTTNQDEMNTAFGVGGWTLESFETLDPAAVFSPATGFVFMDGSDFQASELTDFLAANLADIEAWVFSGGRLFINSAPNEGGDIDFGFDGTTLVYDGFSTLINDVEIVDLAHPAVLGPELPISTTMSGTFYSHATITGTGYSDLITEDGNPSNVILTEKCWGSGRVLMGGMTTTSWHSPTPDVGNWRANLFTYMYNTGCGGGCTYTQEVEVIASPDVDLTVDNTEICEGESVTFTGIGADTYVFDEAGVTEGVPFTPTVIGTTNYHVTGTTTATGCSNIDSIEVTVFPLPDVTATASDYDVCLGDDVTLTGGGADSYTWDLGVTDGVPFTPVSLGTYTYTVTGISPDGCISTATATIDVVDCEPVHAGFEFDNNICFGDCVMLSDTSIGTIVSWQWDFGGAVIPNTSTEQHPTICIDSLGVFDIQLTVTSIYGQVSSTTNSITVNPIPQISTKLDTIIDSGGDANLIAIAPWDGSFYWTPDQTVDCPTCPITTANPLDSTMYTVEFIDENGCKDEDQVMVLVNFIEGVGVPTAFSPNGDGFNDVLYVKGIGLAAVHLVVYNRYGEIVFETSDQELGWDGTYQNRDENPGVFTWVLHYDFINGNKGMQKGNTTLIR